MKFALWVALSFKLLSRYFEDDRNQWNCEWGEDFSVLYEDDETLAQVTSNCTSYLNHCFRTTVCHTYDNPMLLLWVVYLHVVVL